MTARRISRYRLCIPAVVGAWAVVYLSWIIPSIIHSRLQRPIVASIEAAGGSVYFDYELVDGAIGSGNRPPGAFITRWLCGDDIYARVKVVSFHRDTTTDDDVVLLHKLPHLERVGLSGSGVTDESIESLLRIRKLHFLALENTSVTPQGLSRLRSSPRLRFIRLTGLSVTDEHVAGLSGGGSVNTVALATTSVTDLALVAFAEMKGLTCLEIDSCRAITDSGLAELQKQPELKKLRVAGFRSALTDASLKSIARMPHLQRVTLSGRFSDSGVQELQASRPDLLIECQRSAFYHLDLTVEITATPKQEGEPGVGADSR